MLSDPVSSVPVFPPVFSSCDILLKEKWDGAVAPVLNTQLHEGKLDRTICVLLEGSSPRRASLLVTDEKSSVPTPLFCQY